MAKRKRKPRTYDANLGAWYELFGDQSAATWTASSDPQLDQATVPNDTPLPSDGSVLGLRVNVPQQGTTTWYRASAGTIAAGKVQAAVDTLAATGAQITNAIESVATNFVPILLGLAVLYFLFQMEKAK